MDKKTKIVLTVLCLVIAFMDISGLPGVLLNISVADVDPFIIPLMLNFVIIGIIAGVLTFIAFFCWLISL